MTDKKRIAVVRVRGKVNIRDDIEDTLKHLNLTRVNHCAVIDDRADYRGMLNKVNDYATWGEISREAFEKLLAARGHILGNAPVDDAYVKKNSKYATLKKFADDFFKFKAELSDIDGLKPVFRLNPPRKGYDRGGIKQPQARGGALGYRGEKINELIERML